MQHNSKLLKLFIFILAVASMMAFTVISVQNKQTTKTNLACCHVDGEDDPYASIEEFADLTFDDEFVNSHEMPTTVNNHAYTGKMVEFTTADGKTAKAYANMSNRKSNKYLLVIHEWWGLNDNVKKEADQLFKDLKKKNINVLALDLYDGKVATTRKDAGTYMRGTKPKRAAAIINGAIKMANEKAKGKVKIGTIGWCFGGGWSLQSSILAGDQGIGCVMYYGMPEKDESRLKMLKADVLGIFAKKDRWITPKVVGEFEQRMKTVGKKVKVYQYDADHAFANPSSPRYAEKAAKDAYAKTMKFFKKRF
ncbi:MAG TPA: dienelactone hydrolase [Microscillaceae bacterium]|nr:dienelactone hydrolase [Microscillaceae bacterium]